MMAQAGNASPGKTRGLDERTREFYQYALRVLRASGVRFLLGGAYAFQQYTGIERHTKDIDIFVRPVDIEQVLRVFTGAGQRAELTFPHWLGKIVCDEQCVDIIFSSGNGLCSVDEEWFTHAPPAEVLGEPVRLIPIEEMLWSKGFVLERERYDGADIAHLLRVTARTLDWDRLLRRFGAHWRVLYSHLVLFGFIYPNERDAIPAEVMRELARRVETEMASAAPGGNPICNGTLLSREQYLTDIEEWGYQDGRLLAGCMSPNEVQHWTDAIDDGANDRARKGVRRQPCAGES